MSNQPSTPTRRGLSGSASNNRPSNGGPGPSDPPNSPMSDSSTAATYGGSRNGSPRQFSNGSSRSSNSGYSGPVHGSPASSRSASDALSFHSATSSPRASGSAGQQDVQTETQTQTQIQVQTQTQTQAQARQSVATQTDAPHHEQGQQQRQMQVQGQRQVQAQAQSQGQGQGQGQMMQGGSGRTIGGQAATQTGDGGGGEMSYAMAGYLNQSARDDVWTAENRRGLGQDDRALDENAKHQDDNE